MGRRKKWTTDAERMRAKRGTVRSDIGINEQINEQIMPPVKTDTKTNIKWHPEVDLKMFEGKGRGVPVNGFVMISRRSNPNGDTEHGVVTEADWRARLKNKCSHGFWGWSCKDCL